MHLGKGQNVPWKTPKMRLEGKYKNVYLKKVPKMRPTCHVENCFLSCLFPSATWSTACYCQWMIIGGYGATWRETRSCSNLKIPLTPGFSTGDSEAMYSFVDLPRNLFSQNRCRDRSSDLFSAPCNLTSCSANYIFQKRKIDKFI